MLRSLWSRLSSTDDNGTASDDQGKSGDSDAGESDDSGGGFLPSRLDASVLLSHGGPRPERRPAEENQIPEEEHDALKEYHNKK